MVGYFSKDVCVRSTGTTTAGAVATVLDDLIQQPGIPVKLISDNGPPFGSAEFRSHCQGWGITLQPIWPGHSQGNGMIE